jgi:PEP-CTERM motif
MKKLLLVTVATAALLVAVVGGSQAAITTYNDRNLAGNAWPVWSTAIGGSYAPRGSNLYYTSYQDFNTANSFSPASPTYTYVPVNLPGVNMGTVNATVTANNGTSGNYTFSSVVSTPAIGTPDTVRIRFASGVNALGGIWQLDFPPAYTATGLLVKFFGMNGTAVVGQETIAQLTLATQLPEFWGWTFSDKVSVMEISSTEPLGQGFNLTNLEYQSVPEPSTILLFGAGIGGLMIWRRRK